MVQHLVSLSSEYRHFSLPFSLTATVRVPVQSYLRLRGSLQEQGRGVRVQRSCWSGEQQRHNEVGQVGAVRQVERLRAVLRAGRQQQHGQELGLRKQLTLLLLPRGHDQLAHVRKHQGSEGEDPGGGWQRRRGGGEGARAQRERGAGGVHWQSESSP